MKYLLDKRGFLSQTKASKECVEEFRKLIVPFIKKWMGRGYSPSDLNWLTQGTIGYNIAMELVLRQPIKKVKKK